VSSILEKKPECVRIPLRWGLLDTTLCNNKWAILFSSRIRK